jgi:hypothetical protein
LFLMPDFWGVILSCSSCFSVIFIYCKFPYHLFGNYLFLIDNLYI